MIELSSSRYTRFLRQLGDMLPNKAIVAARDKHGIEKRRSQRGSWVDDVVRRCRIGCSPLVRRSGTWKKMGKGEEKGESLKPEPARAREQVQVLLSLLFPQRV